MVIVSIFFLLNIKEKVSLKIKDKTIFNVLNKTMNIPIYRKTQIN